MESAGARARSPSQLGVPLERTEQIWCSGGAPRPLRPHAQRPCPRAVHLHLGHPCAHAVWSRRKKGQKWAGDENLSKMSLWKPLSGPTGGRPGYNTSRQLRFQAAMAWRCSTDAALGGTIQHQTFQDATHVVSVAGQRLKFAPCEALCDPRLTKFHVTGSQVCPIQIFPPRPHRTPRSPLAMPCAARHQRGCDVPENIAVCFRRAPVAACDQRLLLCGHAASLHARWCACQPAFF